MRKLAPLFSALACVFSFYGFAQRHVSSGSKIANTQLTSEQLSQNALAVVSYHVEERINMAFGSTVTTYNVSNLSLVSTHDLGQNNVRVVTPVYGKVRIKAMPLGELPKAQVTVITAPTLKTANIDKIATPMRDKFVKIDVLNTYERILDKGYKSVEMLTRVANSRYFDGDLEIAAKWYTELFGMAKDLEPVYYFRYSQSLKAVGEIEKSKAMMKLYEQKSK